MPAYTPLAQFIPDAASLINEAVDVLRAIIRDASATAETRRRAAAALLHFLVPRPSTRAQKTSGPATGSDNPESEKPVTPSQSVGKGNGDPPLGAAGALSTGASGTPPPIAPSATRAAGGPGHSHPSPERSGGERRVAPTGCPGQRSEAESAGSQEAVGAVAEPCSATNGTPHPITAPRAGPAP